jgi:hypothetical protein
MSLLPSLHALPLRALLPFIIAFAAPAAAQTPPDLSGFWSLAMKQPPDDPGLRAKLPPNTAVLADTGVEEFPSGEYGGLKPKPDALAAAAKWKAADEMALSRVCAAPSIIYSMQGPFPFEIYQTPQMMVFKYEYFDQVRIIFMDGRKHPPQDAPHGKMGHSVGHWEGNELVIDTTHIAPATITNNGLDHSEKVHLVERYKLSADGKTLLATQWFEDPDVLENAGARFIAWTKKPGEYVYAYDCDPSVALEYQQAEAPAESKAP